jgi:hypothetical protein
MVSTSATSRMQQFANHQPRRITNQTRPRRTGMRRGDNRDGRKEKSQTRSPTESGRYFRGDGRVVYRGAGI